MDGTALDVIKAFQKANKALTDWQKADRVAVLANIQEQLIQTAERGETLKTIADETGKPQELIRSQDFVTAAQAFEQASVDLRTQSTKTNHYRAAYGVCVLITPISQPIAYINQKLAAMIATGNTVVVKPSSHTKQTAKILENIFIQAKVPEGVINFVYGKGQELSETLLTHPTINLVQIGGKHETITKVKKLMAQTTATLKTDSGSKNAALILNDADLNQTATILAQVWLSDMGFSANAPARIFIDEKLEPEFFELFKTECESFLRRHFNNSDQNGWLKTGQYYDEFKKAIAQLKEEKGTETQLANPSVKPMLAPPTVTRDLTDCSDIHQREVLGPLLTIRGFKYPFDGVKWANTTTDFNQAAIFTKDKDKAIKLAQTLNAPTIQINHWINSHPESLDSFQVQKTITIN